MGQFVVLKGENPVKCVVLNLENFALKNENTSHLEVEGREPVAYVRKRFLSGEKELYEACWSQGRDEAGRLKRPAFLQLSAIWGVVNKVNHFEKSPTSFRAFKCNFRAFKCNKSLYLNVVNH